MTRTVLIALSLCLVLTPVVAAKDTFAITADGQKVVLHDNGTWEYEGQTSQKANPADSFRRFALDVVDKHSQSESGEVLLTTARPDPSLDRLIKDFYKQLKLLAILSGPKPPKPDDGWFKARTVVLPDYSIDVQQTNSLVSPYIGVLEYTRKYDITVTFNTENEARSAVDYSDSFTEQHKHTYALQDGQWVLTTHLVYSSGTGKWATCNCSF